MRLLLNAYLMVILNALNLTEPKLIGDITHTHSYPILCAFWFAYRSAAQIYRLIRPNRKIYQSVA